MQGVQRSAVQCSRPVLCSRQVLQGAGRCSAVQCIGAECALSIVMKAPTLTCPIVRVPQYTFVTAVPQLTQLHQTSRVRITANQQAAASSHLGYTVVFGGGVKDSGDWGGK